MSPSLPFLEGGGTVGAIMRTHDWAATSLGPAEHWPQSLRTMVALVLHSSTPMFIAWGEDLSLLYNDAYIEILGARHPEALGHPLAVVWPEIWPYIRPLVRTALAGQPVFQESQPFRVERNGFAEDTWFTFSYSPVLDNAGKTGGLYCFLIETTAGVLRDQHRKNEMERLRRLFEQAPSMMVVLRGPEHVFELANASCVRLLSGREVLGRRAVDVAPEVASQGYIALLDRVYASGQPFTGRALPLDLRDAAGRLQRHFMDLVFQPITDADGKVSGIFFEGVDVTESVKATEALRAEEARRQEAAAEALAAAEANAKFRTFFDQGSHFSAVISLSGTVIEANRTSLEGCGFTREQVIGKKFWECGWWSASPALVERIRHASEEAAQGRPVRQEMAYFTSEGAERAVDLIVAPVKDELGRVLFVAPTGTDITERKRVEERLRLLDRMSEATRTASDSKSIMVETTRLLGEFLRADRVAYADVEADNDQFTIRHDWIAPGLASTVGVYSLDQFGTGVAADLRRGRTLVLRDVDKELGPALGSDTFNAIGIKAIICCPLVKAGRLVGMMAVHSACPRAWSNEEIILVEQVVERCWAHIERVRTTEALRESDRRKTEFLATLAHELRNPLAPIQTGLDIIRLAGDTPEAVGRTRQMMERQLTHMVRLIDDLLDVARITRGKVALKQERVSLQRLVTTAVETSEPLIQGGRHTLRVSLPNDTLTLNVDATRISQVISNLLNNAAKYTPPGGNIELAARRENGNAVITVADSGVGIRQELLTTVFDMFTQDRRSIDRAQGGLGIGLTLVRRLVELHGGTVTASSAGPNKGSTFTVVLPLAIGSERRASPRPAEALHGRRFRVLVVDDNTDAAEALSVLLQFAGHTTRVAHDGIAALAAAEAFHPDVVFLDIGMPGMDGYAVARALRQRGDMGEVLLVALTGWSAEQDREQSRGAGFDEHLTKPASLTDVERLLSKLAHAGHATPTH